MVTESSGWHDGPTSEWAIVLGRLHRFRMDYYSPYVGLREVESIRTPTPSVFGLGERGPMPPQPPPPRIKREGVGQGQRQPTCNTLPPKDSLADAAQALLALTPLLLVQPP
jgi:hypothetical protein